MLKDSSKPTTPQQLPICTRHRPVCKMSIWSPHHRRNYHANVGSPCAPPLDLHHALTPRHSAPAHHPGGIKNRRPPPGCSNIMAGSSLPRREHQQSRRPRQDQCLARQQLQSESLEWYTKHKREEFARLKQEEEILPPKLIRKISQLTLGLTNGVESSDQLNTEANELPPIRSLQARREEVDFEILQVYVKEKLQVIFDMVDGNNSKMLSRRDLWKATQLLRLRPFELEELQHTMHSRGVVQFAIKFDDFVRLIFRRTAGNLRSPRATIRGLPSAAAFGQMLKQLDMHTTNHSGFHDPSQQVYTMWSSLVGEKCVEKLGDASLPEIKLARPGGERTKIVLARPQVGSKPRRYKPNGLSECARNFVWQRAFVWHPSGLSQSVHEG